MFNTFEKEVFGRLLDEANDTLANNSCNDFPVKVTKENFEVIKTFINELGIDESEKDYYLDDLISQGEVYFTDFVLLAYLKAKILAA